MGVGYPCSEMHDLSCAQAQDLLFAAYVSRALDFVRSIRLTGVFYLNVY